MAELVYVSEYEPKPEKVQILYRIATRDMRRARYYTSILKIKHGQNKEQEINKDIARVQHYCNTHDEVLETWAIIDKYNKKPYALFSMNSLNPKRH